MDKIFNSAVDKIFFSFDSPDKDEYETIRVNSNYDKTLKNIIRFCDEKKKRGLLHPYTRVSMVKLEGFDEKWSNFQNLFKNHVDSVAGLDYMAQPEYVVTDDFKNQLSDRVINNNLTTIVKDEAIPVADKFCCPQLWQRMFIHPDGVVTPCCTDHRRTLVMGNIFENSVEEIWKNDKYTYLRKMHTSGNYELVPACKGCPLANLK